MWLPTHLISHWRIPLNEYLYHFFVIIHHYNAHHFAFFRTGRPTLLYDLSEMLIDCSMFNCSSMWCKVTMKQIKTVMHWPLAVYLLLFTYYFHVIRLWRFQVQPKILRAKDFITLRFLRVLNYGCTLYVCTSLEMLFLKIYQQENFPALIRHPSGRKCIFICRRLKERDSLHRPTLGHF
jgi:hypothetical protein